MRTARKNLRFLDDLAKVATGALGSLSEVRAQIKTMVKESADRVLSEMDLVTREEFEVVEAMAQKARERQEQLEKRLAALEKQLGGKASAPKRKKK